MRDDQSRKRPETGHAIAEWLRLELARQGMRPATLHRASGVGRSTIDHILKATRQADQRTIEKLAHALGVAAPQLGQVVAWAGSPPGAQTPREAISLAMGYLEEATRLLEAQDAVERADAAAAAETARGGARRRVGRG